MGNIVETVESKLNGYDTTIILEQGVLKEVSLSEYKKRFKKVEDTYNLADFENKLIVYNFVIKEQTTTIYIYLDSQCVFKEKHFWHETPEETQKEWLKILEHMEEGKENGKEKHWRIIGPNIRIEGI